MTDAARQFFMWIGLVGAAGMLALLVLSFLPEAWFGRAGRLAGDAWRRVRGPRSRPPAPRLDHAALRRELERGRDAPAPAPVSRELGPYRSTWTTVAPCVCERCGNVIEIVVHAHQDLRTSKGPAS